jgi:hypothetical protein
VLLVARPLIRLRHHLPVRGEKDHRILRCARIYGHERRSSLRQGFLPSVPAYAFVFILAYSVEGLIFSCRAAFRMLPPAALTAEFT